MPREDIHEGSKLSVKVYPKTGRPKDDKAKFVFAKDGVEVESVEAKMEPRGGASCEYVAPLVDDDKEAYDLTYWVVADGAETRNGDKFRVWPKKGKIKALNHVDGKPMPGFSYYVGQNGSWTHGPETKGDGTAEFDLAPGEPFKLNHSTPFEIKEWVKKTGREREVKAVQNFTAEFKKPTLPSKGDPDKGVAKQYINQKTETPSTPGGDRRGPVVLIEVGAKPDPALGPDVSPAAEGTPVYIEVTFDRASKRKDTVADKKPRVIDAELDVVELKAKGAIEDDKPQTYTCQVKLKAKGAPAQFKVHLGLAGGDTCTIKIGSTDQCADATLKLQNWRKLFYEILAPSCIDLDELVTPDGKELRPDLKEDMRKRLKERAAKAFFEYECVKSHQFEKEDVKDDGSWYPSEFLGRPTGGSCYVLTDFTFKKYPKIKAFTKPEADHQICLKLCDANYFFDGAPTESAIDRVILCSDKKTEYDVKGQHSGFFMKQSAHKNGGEALKKLEWTAKVDPNAYKKHAPLTVAAGARAPAADDASSITITVREAQGQSAQVVFTKVGEGKVPTEVGSSEQSKLEGMFTTLFGDEPKLRKAGFKLDVTIDAPSGGGDHDTRFSKVEAAVKAAYESKKKLIAYHPGLDDNGVARKGDLDKAKDLVEVTIEKFQIVLPDTTSGGSPGPGSFVGAASDTKCPVNVAASFEVAHEGLGLAGSGAQKGENLVVYRTSGSAWESTTDVLLHELGHSMGLVVWSGPPPGLTVPKHWDQDDADTGEKGHAYQGMGHSGTHCAFGIASATKELVAGQANAGKHFNYNNTKGSCIMYGANNGNGPSLSTTGFCEQCTKFINAFDLTKIGG